MHSYRIHKSSPIIPIPSRINPVSRIDIYFLRSVLIFSSDLRLGFSKGLFPAGLGLPVNILKALLPSSILPTCPAHLSLLKLITLTILCEGYEVPHCGAFYITYSHPSWVQIFASGSCFKIPLAWIPPLM